MKTLTLLFVLSLSLFSQRPANRPSKMLPYFKSKTPINYSDLRKEAFTKKRALTESSFFKGLKWHSLGPTVMGGRVTDIAVPDQSYFTFYVASANGGVWKTENNGTSWHPIFDSYESVTIGDIAVAPSDPNVLWVGTGENNSLRSSYAGTGLYKSADGGKTFEHMGLSDSHHIGRIIIHPTNPEIIYVAAIGHLYTENEERGIFKSVNGGQTWEKILYKGTHVGFIDVTFSANNPDILFAAAWERNRKAWDFVESGKGSGIYKSNDAGQTWQKCTNGFPENRFVGRIGLGVTPANPNVVYAMLDNQAMAAPASDKDKKFSKSTTSNDIDSVLTAHQIYRSNDLGETWQRVSDRSKEDLFTGPYGYFFGNISVDPTNENILYSLDVSLRKSFDGGKNWTNITLGKAVHADHHALWINPQNPKHIINGNDGGIDISYDAGETWQHSKNLPIGQFYTINVDHQTPYNVYGGMQDNGTWRGPSKTLRRVSDIDDENAKWTHLTGGDGFHIQIDPEDPELFYSEFQWGSLIRTEHGKQTYIQPKPKNKTEKYRFNWSAPVVLSAHNRYTLYFGGNKLFKSLNRGDEWREISPDLSKQDSTKKGDVTFGTITTIAESSFDPDLLYVGTDDGNVWRTDDGGHHWTFLAQNLPNRWVTRIIASTYEKDRVYLSFSGYREDEMTSYLFRSDDKGKNWTSIANNLPNESVNVIREDYKNKTMVYLGTDLGVYLSPNLGETWTSLSNNLPTSAVHDMVQQSQEGDLLIATHGRGIYKLNGKVVSAYTDSIAKLPIHLFELDDLTHGYEMAFNGYFTINEPQYVKIEILDKHKKPVKTLLDAELGKGYHEFFWDGLPDSAESPWDIIKKETHYLHIESDAEDIYRKIKFKE